MLGDCEDKCHAFALLCSPGVNLWPLLGQNTGLARWSEPARLFIGFCITNSQSIRIPNQSQRTVHLVLLSANICLNRSLLIQYIPLAQILQQILIKKSSQMYLYVRVHACIHLLTVFSLRLCILSIFLPEIYSFLHLSQPASISECEMH